MVRVGSTGQAVPSPEYFQPPSGRWSSPLRPDMIHPIFSVGSGPIIHLPLPINIDTGYLANTYPVLGCSKYMQAGHYKCAKSAPKTPPSALCGTKNSWYLSKTSTSPCSAFSARLAACAASAR